MKNKNNFEINLLDGFFSDNTLSESGHFYKMKHPVEINMGNWACKGKFFNKDGKLVYYNESIWLHNISVNDNKLVFVKWSLDGESCAVYEYERAKTYDLVLLSFKENVEYRIDLNDFKLDLGLLENFVLEDLVTKYSFSKNPFRMPDLEQKKWLFKDKWYPI